MNLVFDYLILGLLIFLLSIQIIYLIKFWIAHYKIQEYAYFDEFSMLEDIGISLVICGHNESSNISKNLVSFLKAAPKGLLFECIYVNDRSTDSSSNELQKIIQEYNTLKIIDLPLDVPKILPGKKDALMHGIYAAKGEFIVLTDADCWIEDEQWITHWWKWMKTHNADVGLGIGLHAPASGFLNKFIQFETLNTFMQYGSLSIEHNAYMGVGRNLAYKRNILKDIFQDQEFLNFYSSTPGGDDDLLITYLQSKNYKILPFFNSEQATFTNAESDWSSYWSQKSRHVSTGKYYSKTVQKKLGIYALSQSLFWILALGFVIFYPHVLSFIILASYVLLKSMLYKKWQSFSKYRQNSFIFVFYELIWTMYHLYLSPYIFWKNKQEWRSS